MKQTRVRILSKTAAWIKDPNALQICWITGMAGTGKTSIAKTICEHANADAGIVLGGSFFCSRSTGLAAQRDIRCVIPTLTQLLALDSVQFRLALAGTIRDGIQHKEVAAQVRHLLHAPLSTLKDASVPILFVIDAIDECGGDTTDGLLDDTQCHAVVASLLEALVSLTQSDPRLPVKFLITSRPEAQIRDTSISNDKLSQILRLHTVGSVEINADIKRYITETLNTKLSTKPKLRASITESDIETLVQLCDGLFIVAATAMAHTFSVGAAAAVSQFKKLLNSSQDGLNDRATAPLDRMYEIILKGAAREDGPGDTELPTLHRLLASLLSARMTLSVTALADLSNLESYDVTASLSRLHAVVHVPEDDDTPGLRTVHASFGDYMYTRAPNHIRIRQSLGHEVLAHGCLDIIAKQLRFNISQSQSSYEPNTPNRPDSISLSLEYACMHWVHHIVPLVDTGNLDAKIGAIFRPRLLPWLEVMSVLRQVWRATRMLFAAAGLALIQADSGLVQFLCDARSFVALSHEAIERSAPHIYISALPFSDRDSLVYQDFALRCDGLITVDTLGIGQHGGRGIMTLTGHNGAVTSVSYSPDGLLLVSGSTDGSVRIWDTRTGEEAMFPMRSGDGKVLSVDFARNGKWVGSGTESGSVWVWNVTPGQASQRMLSGHITEVNCVAFSSDSSRLASASSDKTVRLWNADTGEQLAVQNGHNTFVEGIAFSVHDDIVASIDDDGEFRQWDITGQVAGQQLTPPTDDLALRLAASIRSRVSACSVHFSPDGQMLARTDRTGNVVLQHWKTNRMIASLRSKTTISSVRFSPNSQSLVMACGTNVWLWTLQPDPQHGSCVNLGGHGGKVNWVTFSPDGLYIVSASDDTTIRIWSVESGPSPVQPLPMHQGAVRSVAASHDGAVIVSGSEDRSMRVWNAFTGLQTIPPLCGHTRTILSVSISPDGRLIASASADHTVRLWDTQSGAAVGKPMCDHTNFVRALSFSNNGRWLVSASDDKTVHIWDVATQRRSVVDPLRCQHWVFFAVFSPDDVLVAAGDRSGQLYLWRTDTGQQAREPFYVNDGSVYSLAFSPDGTRIVSGGYDNTSRIWDIDMGQCLLPLRGHTGSIWSVAWSLDASFIGTGSADATVYLWDAMTGVPLASLRGHTKTIRSVTFTRDGQFIVSGSDDTTVRKWDIRAACRPSESRNKYLAALASATLKDGWLVGASGELILWVPVEYRMYLVVYPCALRIDRSSVVIGIGDTGLHAGMNWTSCWRG